MIRLLFALTLAAAWARPAQDDPATVTGVVRFEGTHKPRTLNAQIDGDKHKHGGPHRDGTDVLREDVVVGSKGELANVLVRVKSPVTGEFPAPKESVNLDAAGWQFRPRVLALRPGQKLILKNSAFDRFNFHGVGSINGSFDHGVTRGSQVDVTLKKPEVGFKVSHLCCPFQVAWIHVIDHPFFAVTGPDGTFEIKGLPAGEYEIEAWHEVFGTKAATVKVGARETKVQDFTFEKKP